MAGFQHHIFILLCGSVKFYQSIVDVKNVKDVDFKGRSKTPRKNVDFKAIVVVCELE